MASAHPHKTVPIAAQCGKPCSVASATAASACSCTAGTSRRNCVTKAASTRAYARLRDATAYEPTPGPRGCVSEPEPGTPVTSGSPRQRIGRQHPDRGPWRNIAVRGGRACHVRCRPPDAGGPRATRPAATMSTQGKNGPQDRERSVVGLLRQAQQRVPKLTSDGVLCPCMIKLPQPIEDRDQLRASRPPAGTTPVPACRLLRLGRRKPFRDLQRRTEGNCRVKACWRRSEVSGRVVRSSSAVVKWRRLPDGPSGRWRAGRPLPVANGLLASPASV